MVGPTDSTRLDPITPTLQAMVLGGAWADLDADGDMDFLLATDGGVRQYMYIHCTSATGVRYPSNSLACADCPVASIRSATSDQCQECAANTERGGTGTCVACAPGSDRLLGLSGCAQCPLGYATVGDAETCTICAPGFHAGRVGSIFCSVCMPGSYSSGYGNSNCTTAPPGYYAGTGGTEPKPCAVGRYGDSYGRSDDQCTGKCTDGHYCALGTTVPNPPACDSAG